MKPHPAPDPQRLIAAHAAATEFYRSRIQAEPRALAYLRSRGIVAATAHAPPWTLGYAPPGWTHLRDRLRQAGYTDDELLAAGLVTTTANGNPIDVFRDRVMFPIRNASGQVAAFTGRDLSGRANTAKYRNTTTTAIYSKKHMLYGMAEQLGDDTQPAALMLVEGPTDVVAVARLRQSVGADEYRQPYVAVAPCGTALTSEQVARLAEVVPPGTPVVVAFDPDTAGRNAMDKSYELLREWPGKVQAIALPAGADPAELVAQGRANAVQTFEQARRPLADLLIDRRLARFRLDEIPGRVAGLHAVAPLVADVAARDVGHATRLMTELATRLELNPLTVFEAVYPPADHDEGPDVASSPGSQPDARPHQRPATPLGGAGFPDPELVGHQYARLCPPAAPAAIWVQHDTVTGHTAWVVAEGVTDSSGDRDAARLAAEVAGRAAVLVGAHDAVAIARAAVDAHFAQPGAGRGDAAIAVLTTFDGDRPTHEHHRFTVAWAGDIKAYGTTGRWFAPLTADHTLRGRAIGREPITPVVAGDGTLTASVRGGAIGVNRINMPLHQIAIIGRPLTHTAPDRIRHAIEWRNPADAVAQLARTGGPATAALVVRPRPNRTGRIVNAAQLARQDQAAGAVAHPWAPLPTRPTRRALPTAPAHPQPVR
jgi:DNA primase catalytic core